LQPCWDGGLSPFFFFNKKPRSDNWDFFYLPSRAGQWAFHLPGCEFYPPRAVGHMWVSRPG
jgi:hypothetical protein